MTIEDFFPRGLPPLNKRGAYPLLEPVQRPDGAIVSAHCWPNGVVNLCLDLEYDSIVSCYDAQQLTDIGYGNPQVGLLRAARSYYEDGLSPWAHLAKPRPFDDEIDPDHKRWPPNPL